MDLHAMESGGLRVFFFVIIFSFLLVPSELKTSVLVVTMDSRTLL